MGLYIRYPLTDQGEEYVMGIESLGSMTGFIMSQEAYEADDPDEAETLELFYASPKLEELRKRFNEGLYKLWADSQFFESFLAAVKDQGAQGLGEGVTREWLAEELMGFIVAECYTERAYNEDEIDVYLGLIREYYPKLGIQSDAKRKELLLHEAKEAVFLAYQNGDMETAAALDKLFLNWDLIKLRIDFQDTIVDDPGYVTRIGTYQLFAGGELVEEWLAKVNSFFEISSEALDWEVEEDYGSEGPAEEVMDLLESVDLDYDPIEDLGSPSQMYPEPDGEGAYIVFIDGEEFGRYEDKEDAEELGEIVDSMSHNTGERIKFSIEIDGDYEGDEEEEDW